MIWSGKKVTRWRWSRWKDECRKPPDRPGGKMGVEGRQAEQVERLMPGKAGGNIGVEGRQVEYVEKCAQMASR